MRILFFLFLISGLASAEQPKPTPTATPVPTPKAENKPCTVPKPRRDCSCCAGQCRMIHYFVAPGPNDALYSCSTDEAKSAPLD